MFQHSDDPEGKSSLLRGLRETFWILTIIAFIECIFLLYGLKRKSSGEVKKDEDVGNVEERKLKHKLVSGLKELPRGFVIAKGEKHVMLAFLSSFAVSEVA